MSIRGPQTALSAIAALLAGLACSGRYEGGLTSGSGPSPADFSAVAETLDGHCGSLTCHGAAFRNLRLYGKNGRRLDPGDVPGGRATTDAEVEADYRSVIGLEPELARAVAESGGAQPERLTLVRKARGTEAHVGGAVFPKGSNGDLCIVSFVSDKTDVPSCNNSLLDP